MAALLEKATSALSEAKESVTAITETVKTEAAAAPEKVSGTMSTQARDAVDNVLSKGTEEAKSLLHNFEEKNTEVSSKLVGDVTNVISEASSSTVIYREFPISIDYELRQICCSCRRVPTPWWKNCCGVLDLLKTYTTK